MGTHWYLLLYSIWDQKSWSNLSCVYYIIKLVAQIKRSDWNSSILSIYHGSDVESVCTGLYHSTTLEVTT